MALQIDGRTGPCEAAPLGNGSISSRRVISSTGTSTRRSRRLGSLASTIWIGRYTGALAKPSNSVSGSSPTAGSPVTGEAPAGSPPPRPKNEPLPPAGVALQTVRCVESFGPRDVPGVQETTQDVNHAWSERP